MTGRGYVCLTESENPILSTKKPHLFIYVVFFHSRLNVAV